MGLENSMKTYSKEELEQILEQHRIWLTSGGSEGRKADLSEADLNKADLRWADLRWANLRKADLSKADLSYANLSEADLREADLTGADIQNIKNKYILTFQAGKHFAYFCDGFVKIGCITNTVDWWRENYKRVGEHHKYSEVEISRYGDFIQLCFVWRNRYE